MLLFVVVPTVPRSVEMTTVPPDVVRLLELASLSWTVMVAVWPTRRVAWFDEMVERGLPGFESALREVQS